MLARVDLHPRVEGQHDDLAGRVAADGDASRAARDRHDVRHAEERPLGPLQVHDRERNVVALPEHAVVLEVHPLVRCEVDVDDRHDLAFDLARALVELDLGHVAQARRRAPAQRTARPRQRAQPARRGHSAGAAGAFDGRRRTPFRRRGFGHDASSSRPSFPMTSKKSQLGDADLPVEMPELRATDHRQHVRSRVVAAAAANSSYAPIADIAIAPETGVAGHYRPEQALPIRGSAWERPPVGRTRGP